MTESEKAKKQADETRASTKSRASAAAEKKPAARKPAAKKEEPKEEKVETVEHPLPQDDPAPLENLPGPVTPKKASGRTADGPDAVDHTGDLEGHEYWTLWRSKAYIHATQMEENFFATGPDGVGHTGLAGDYLVVGVLDDVWVVPKEEFQRRFEPLAPAKA